MTEAVKLLSDEEVTRFLALSKQNTGPSFGYTHDLCKAVAALCATVRALRADVDRFCTLADERHDLLCAERRANDELRAERARMLRSLERAQKARNAYQVQLVQVTQERDRLQGQLAEEVAKRVNANVERMKESQKITQAELERHCSDDRLSDTQRGSYD